MMRRGVWPILLLALALLLAACSPLNTAVDVVDAIPSEVLSTATPAPTATPGPLEEAVSTVADSTGIDSAYFLGLTGEDWINLAVSLLLVLASYVVGTVLARVILHFLVRSAAIEFKDAFSKAVGVSLKWLVVVFTLQFATTRLVFITPRLQTILGNTYFVLKLVFVLGIIWKLIDYAEYWYRQKLAPPGEPKKPDPVVGMLRRVLHIFLLIIGASILMNRYGLSANVMTVTIAILGLALSFAARDTITDTISGFIILIDKPFRVGDTIEVEKISDWGIVREIGLRTTRIVTYDNRGVIIPNSIIGKNVVINYTYPDPRYRVETLIRVPYGTDIKTARQVITGAIHQLEGVLSDDVVDHAVEVLCHEIGESAMILRVWWWIANYDDIAFVRDRVIEAVQDALLENGLSLAHPVRDINLRVTADTGTQLSQTFGKDTPSIQA